jgi:hypothetical protein
MPVMVEERQEEAGKIWRRVGLRGLLVTKMSGDAYTCVSMLLLC